MPQIRLRAECLVDPASNCCDAHHLESLMQSFSGGAHMRTAEEAARMAHDVAVAQDPGGVARQAIAKLPAYEYAVPLSYIRP